MNKIPEEYLKRGEGNYKNCCDYDDAIQAMKDYATQCQADNAVYKQDLNEMERVKNKLHEQVKTQSETIGMYQEICQEVFGEQNPLYVKQKIANQTKDNAERKYTFEDMRNCYVAGSYVGENPNEHFENFLTSLNK